MRVNVYVDGFNLYFGAVQNTPYRWLDIAKLAEQLLSPVFTGFQINHIRYFTATVSDDPKKPGSRARQLTYLRALRTLPRLSIHESRFMTQKKSYPLANGTGFAEIIRREEKGSDVNIGSLLVIDGADHCYDVALIISNDTDLLMPIQIVRDRFGVAIGIAAPVYHKNRRPNRELEAAADFTVHITKQKKELLKACQLPNTIHDAQGRFARPAEW